LVYNPFLSGTDILSVYIDGLQVSVVTVPIRFDTRIDITN
jgi:hypothetical protein